MPQLVISRLQEWENQQLGCRNDGASLSQVFMMRRGATFISHLVEGPDTLRAVPGFTPRFASNPGGPVARDMQEGMR